MIKFFSQLFKYDEEKKTAVQMVEALRAVVSPKLMAEGKTVMSAKKISRALERIYEIARNYQSRRKAGAVRRAVFANKFKWELKESGYPESFVDVAVEGLLVELGKAS